MSTSKSQGDDARVNSVRENSTMYLFIVFTIKHIHLLNRFSSYVQSSVKHYLLWFESNRSKRCVDMLICDNEYCLSNAFNCKTLKREHVNPQPKLILWQWRPF